MQLRSRIQRLEGAQMIQATQPLKSAQAQNVTTNRKEKLLELTRICTTIEEAVSVSVHSIQVPGIVDAAVRSVAVTPQHVQQVATQLARHGQSEIEISTEIELFLRVSNDVLSSIQVCAVSRLRNCRQK
jgi:hypothetical protein